MSINNLLILNMVGIAAYICVLALYSQQMSTTLPPCSAVNHPLAHASIDFASIDASTPYSEGELNPHIPPSQAKRGLKKGQLFAKSSTQRKDGTYPDIDKFRIKVDSNALFTGMCKLIEGSHEIVDRLRELSNKEFISGLGFNEIEKHWMFDINFLESNNPEAFKKHTMPNPDGQGVCIIFPVGEQMGPGSLACGKLQALYGADGPRSDEDFKPLLGDIVQLGAPHNTYAVCPQATDPNKFLYMIPNRLNKLGFVNGKAQQHFVKSRYNYDEESGKFIGTAAETFEIFMEEDESIGNFERASESTSSSRKRTSPERLVMVALNKVKKLNGHQLLFPNVAFIRGHNNLQLPWWGKFNGLRFIPISQWGHSVAVRHGLGSEDDGEF